METTDWLVLLAVTAVIAWLAYKAYQFKKWAINEFDEQVDTEVFDIMHYRLGALWPDRIRHLYHNRMDLKDMDDWINESASWKSCACGHLDPRIRKAFDGSPVDRELYKLGSEFLHVWEEVADLYSNGDIENSKKQLVAKEFAENLMQLCIDIDNRELEILSEVAPYNENFK